MNYKTFKNTKHIFKDMMMNSKLRESTIRQLFQKVQTHFSLYVLHPVVIVTSRNKPPLDIILILSMENKNKRF